MSFNEFEVVASLLLRLNDHGPSKQFVEHLLIEHSASKNVDNSIGIVVLTRNN